jgi:biotin operon repressor
MSISNKKLLKKFLQSVQKPSTEDRETRAFIEAWNAAGSHYEIAKKLGWTRQKVRDRAKYLRRQGTPLKWFQKHNEPQTAKKLSPRPTYAVEYDVDMPEIRNRYPFAEMRTGGSFEIEGETEARKVRNAAYQYARKVNTEDKSNNYAFALRNVGNRGGAKIFRLWRIK